nr:MAG TPA: hypothetical protein [Caudoviricetes sp.]
MPHPDTNITNRSPHIKCFMFEEFGLLIIVRKDREINDRKQL